MIEIVRGHLSDCKAEVLVNPVSCSGFAGSGPESFFRERFPEIFHIYEQACRRRELTPGQVLVVPRATSSPPRYIFHLATRQLWSDLAQVETILAGLSRLVTLVEELKVASIAFPPLLTVSGSFHWDTLLPHIQDNFAVCPHVHVLLFEFPDSFLPSTSSVFHRYLVGI